MPQTRMKSGAIRPVGYSPADLQKRGSAAVEKAASPRRTKVSKKAKRLSKTAALDEDDTPSKILKVEIKSPPEDDLDFTASNLTQFDDPAKAEIDAPQDGAKLDLTKFPKAYWKWPKSVIGREDSQTLSGDNFATSNIQRADLRVEQWKEIFEFHVYNHPAGARHSQAMYKEACSARAKLLNNELNNAVRPPNLEKTAVVKRLQTLNWALDTSRFEPERENIRAAIEAYNKNVVTYGKDYAVFYAGKVVDRVNSYADLVKTRHERLDRYAAKYGPHWLWFEPPLDGGSELNCLASATASRDPNMMGFNSYHINMRFWKQEGWVRRLDLPLASHPNRSITIDDPMGFWPTSAEGEVYTGLDGPKITFNMVLDSGSSIPVLDERDIHGLGIVDTTYAAQSVLTSQTTMGRNASRIYELYAEVVGEDGQSLVDASNRSRTDALPYIGSLTPVTVSKHVNHHAPYPLRLSGMLPFLTTYLSSAPGRNVMSFGEDRADVVGLFKLPPHRRWDVTKGFRLPPDLTQWDKIKSTRAIFVHNDGQIIDEDEAAGRSSVTINAGQPNEVKHVRDLSTVADRTSAFWDLPILP
ncbi:MAG: hypothetical protein M1825_002754 [Sarcosagium campestre]|nr:MAG: hypothetical protein M1825_002754 [Sarcosagium campestre]